MGAQNARATISSALRIDVVATPSNYVKMNFLGKLPEVRCATQKLVARTAATGIRVVKKFLVAEVRKFIDFYKAAEGDQDIDKKERKIQELKKDQTHPRALRGSALFPDRFPVVAL